MKIISWNVNGLRAVERKGNFNEIFSYQPDILCLQETKASEEQLDDEVKQKNGYTAYFSSSTKKKGYSGVGLYATEPLERVTYGIGQDDDDDEGRVIEAHVTKPFPFILFNVYFPNGGGGVERLQYKLNFYDAFLSYIEKLKKDGHSIIFCGDVNTAHHEIDLARPKENEDRTGFLPEERAWIDSVVDHGYVDAFRHLYPDRAEAYTYWDLKTRARDRNVGWRIDYFFVSADIISRVKNVRIITEQYGSDHAPVLLEII